MVKQVWAAVLLLSAGCAAPTAAPVRGAWGGLHVGLTVTDAGSSLEFNCAAGTVPGAFTLDTAGRFDLSGTYTPGGGPEPVDPPPPLSARYAGRVTGRSMTLTVDPEGDVPRGRYTLRQNEPPQIFACL